VEVKEDKSEALAEELVPNRPFFTPARDASLVFLFPGDRVDCFSRKSNLFVNLLANRVHLFLAIASVKPYIYMHPIVFGLLVKPTHLGMSENWGTPKPLFSGKMAYSSVDFLGASF